MSVLDAATELLGVDQGLWRRDPEAMARVVERLLGHPPSRPSDATAVPLEVQERYRMSDDPKELFSLDSADLGFGPGARGDRAIRFSDEPYVALSRANLGPLSLGQISRLLENQFSQAEVYNENDGSHVDPQSRDASLLLIRQYDWQLPIQIMLTQVMNDHGAVIAKLEPLQLVRYGEGQKYEYHHDYYPRSYLESLKGKEEGGQRQATVIVYLNDNYLGGETAFPSLGFKLKPQVGDVLYFENTILGAIPDIRTRHAGLPVTAGEKRILVTWVRQAPWRVATEGAE